MEYLFNSLYERDMDVLFMGLFQTDERFVRFVLKQAGLSAQQFEVLSVELSHTESGLGESDVTVCIKIDNQIYGLLIEDKIDAIAAKDQHKRYIKRGEVGVKKGYYQAFEVFIFCPQKYWEKDDEAKQYEYHIFYEDFVNFYAEAEDSLSQFRRKQFESALEQAKNPPKVTLNRRANAFFRKYYEYKETYYPTLWLTTKPTSNGYWAHYNTHYRDAYIYHKIQEHEVCLILPNCKSKVKQVEKIAEWLNTHGMSGVHARRAGKSATLWINVPKLDMSEAFECVPEEELRKCFDAVKEFVELANVLEEFRDLLEKPKK